MHLAPQTISFPISFHSVRYEVEFKALHCDDDLKRYQSCTRLLSCHLPQYHQKYDPFSCVLNPWVLSFVIDIGGLCMIACLAHHGEDDYNCPSHLICDYNLGYCITPTGASCDSSSDCPDTEYCNGQICLIGLMHPRSWMHQGPQTPSSK